MSGYKRLRAAEFAAREIMLVVRGIAARAASQINFLRQTNIFVACFHEKSMA